MMHALLWRDSIACIMQLSCRLLALSWVPWSCLICWSQMQRQASAQPCSFSADRLRTSCLAPHVWSHPRVQNLSSTLAISFGTVGVEEHWVAVYGSAELAPHADLAIMVHGYITVMPSICAASRPCASTHGACATPSLDCTGESCVRGTDSLTEGWTACRVPIQPPQPKLCRMIVQSWRTAVQRASIAMCITVRESAQQTPLA